MSVRPFHFGYSAAAATGKLFCDIAVLEQVIREKIPPRFKDNNLQALRLGANAAA